MVGFTALQRKARVACRNDTGLGALLCCFGLFSLVKIHAFVLAISTRHPHQGTRTAAPVNRPERRSSSARLACSRG